MDLQILVFFPFLPADIHFQYPQMLLKQFVEVNAVNERETQV